MAKFMVYPIYSMDVLEWLCFCFARCTPNCPSAYTPLDLIIGYVTLYEFYDVSA